MVKLKRVELLYEIITKDEFDEVINVVEHTKVEKNTDEYFKKWDFLMSVRTFEIASESFRSDEIFKFSKNFLWSESHKSYFRRKKGRKRSE